MMGGSAPSGGVRFAPSGTFGAETVSAGVEMHHSIDTLELQEFCPIIAVHLAQELAPGRIRPAVNDTLISQLGLNGHLSDWCSIVTRETGAPLAFSR